MNSSRSFEELLEIADSHRDRLLGETLDGVRDLNETIEDKVAAGLVRGAKALLADEEFIRMASEKLSTHVLIQGGRQASQWIGGRILTAFMIAVTGFGVAWLVKNGKI